MRGALAVHLRPPPTGSAADFVLVLPTPPQGGSEAVGGFNGSYNGPERAMKRG